MSKYLSKKKAFQRIPKSTEADILRKLNVPIISLHNTVPFITQMGYGCKQKRRHCVDINDVPAFLLSRHKESTNELLARNELPIPKSFHVKTEKELERALPELNYPLVAKPTDSFGSEDVHINISDRKDALTAFQRIIKK